MPRAHLADVYPNKLYVHIHSSISVQKCTQLPSLRPARTDRPLPTAPIPTPSSLCRTFTLLLATHHPTGAWYRTRRLARHDLLHALKPRPQLLEFLLRHGLRGLRVDEFEQQRFVIGRRVVIGRENLLCCEGGGALGEDGGGRVLRFLAGCAAEAKFAQAAGYAICSSRAGERGRCVGARIGACPGSHGGILAGVLFEVLDCLFLLLDLVVVSLGAVARVFQCITYGLQFGVPVIEVAGENLCAGGFRGELFFDAGHVLAEHFLGLKHGRRTVVGWLEWETRFQRVDNFDGFFG